MSRSTGTAEHDRWTLDSELYEGEQLVWTGKPSPSSTAKSYSLFIVGNIVNVLFMMSILGYSQGWFSSAAEPNAPVGLARYWNWQSAFILVLICLSLFRMLKPLQEYVLAMSTTYGISTERIIVARTTWLDTITSYWGKDIVSVVIKPTSENRCNIIVTKNAGSHDTVVFKLFGIADGEAAKAAIEDLRLKAPGVLGDARISTNGQAASQDPSSKFIAEVVNRELSDGERIVWSGMPNPIRAALGGWRGVVGGGISLLLTFIFFFPIWFSPQSYIAMIVIALPMVAIGLYAVFAPMINLINSYVTIHIVTTERMLTFVKLAHGYKKISRQPGGIFSVERRGMAHANGTIVLDRGVSHGEGGDSPITDAWHYVPNVRACEGAIRALMCRVPRC